MRICFCILLLTGSCFALPQYGGNVQVDNSEVEQTQQKEVEDIFQTEVLPDDHEHSEHSDGIDVLENHEHKIHDGLEPHKSEEPQHSEHSGLKGVIEIAEHDTHEEGSEPSKSKDPTHSEQPELEAVIETAEHKIHEEGLESPKSEDPTHSEHPELKEVIETAEHDIHKEGSEPPKSEDPQHSEQPELKGVIETAEHKIHEEGPEPSKSEDSTHSDHPKLEAGIESTEHKIHEESSEHPKTQHPEQPELLDHPKHPEHPNIPELHEFPKLPETIEETEFTKDHKEKLKKYWWKVSGIFGGTDGIPTDAEPGVGVGGPFTPHQSKFCEKGFDCVPWEICVDGHIALDGQEILQKRIKPVKPPNFETLKCGQEGNICCAIPEDILIAHEESVGTIDVKEEPVEPHQPSGDSGSSKVDYEGGYGPSSPIESTPVKEDGTSGSIVPFEPVGEIGEADKPAEPVIVNTDVRTDKEGNYDSSANVQVNPDLVETSEGEIHESSIQDSKSEASLVGGVPESSVHTSPDIKSEIPVPKDNEPFVHGDIPVDNEPSVPEVSDPLKAAVVDPGYDHISSSVVEDEKTGVTSLDACGHLNQECVPYFQCVNGVINVDGTGLIDVRIKPQSVCTHPKFPNVPGVCCSRPGGYEPTPAPISQCPDHQECVPPNLCSADGVTHTDGAGVLNLRTGHKKCVTTPGAQGICCNRPPVSIETCPDKSICVSKLECVGEAMNEANEFIKYVSTGSWTHCSKYADGVCCKQPERVVQDVCPQKSVCIPKEQCPGLALDDTGKFVDYIPGGSWSDCVHGGVNGVCCILHKALDTCPEKSQCLEFEQCNGQALDQNGKFTPYNYKADGFWKVCFLESSIGVCCISSKPVILDTCPGNSVCLSPEQCVNGQALDETGKFLDYILSGSWSHCSLGNANGVCCVPPTPVIREVCPEGSRCVLGNQCTGQALDGYNKFIDYVPSGSWSHCSLSSENGICCKSLPSRIVDTCPPQSVCVKPDQCGGKALNEANNFVDYSVDATWTHCSQYDGGICCQDIRTPKIPDYLQPAPLCGVRNYNIDERITSSKVPNEAAFGEFPWQSIIFYQNLTFVCGASLVSNKFVITAAHCLDGIQPHDIKIRFGEYVTSSEEEDIPFVDRNVYRIHIHPEFNPKNVHKDLAVIEIEEPIEFQYHINSVCIPKQGYMMVPRTQCFATGWGKDSFEGSFQTTLKKIDLPFIDHDRCENLLRKTRLGKYFRLDHSFNCAGGEENKDACYGDGGGPLVCKDKGTSQYQLIGITSWGIGCGQKDVPGVYANIPEYSNWINDIIRIRSEIIPDLPSQIKEAVQPSVPVPVHEDQGPKIEELEQQKQQPQDIGIPDVPEQVKQDHQQQKDQVEAIPDQPVPGYGK